MKGNVINLNTLHLNSVRLNGIGKVQSVSLKGGSTEDPVFPPVEPPVEPEPTPTYTLSASVTNGMVSAKRNGSAVNLPFTANEGDVIVVEVTPNDGYAFEGWNDGNTDNPRSITMNADVALSAQCVEVVQPPVGNYIQFEDKAVEAICVENWSSDGIGLTMEDAAKVTTIGNTFKGNTGITSFNEFRHFTKVTSLAYDAFYESSIQEITFPDTLTTIAEGNANYGAFYKCSALRRVVANGLTSLGRGAFRDCGSLEEIVIDWSKVKTLGVQAFFGCVLLNVEEINLASCTSYGYNTLYAVLVKRLRLPILAALPTSSGANYMTFGAKDVLEFVELSDKITTIPNYSFDKYIALKSAIVRASTPPTLNSYSFRDTTCIFYVPDASLEAYKTATNWNNFSSRIKPLSELSDE